MSYYKDKTILVTGASSGIGEALAREFAAEGAHLVLTARRGDRLDALAAELASHRGIRTTVIVEDLSDPAAPERLHQHVRSLGLGIDILVNNAGLGDWTDFATSDPAAIDRLLSVNVRSLVLLSRLFIPELLERKSGGIINIGSTASFIPVPGLAVYAATKAFVLSFSESLWGEYHPRGLRVLALCPGNTTTGFDEVAKTRIQGVRYDTAETVAKQTLDAFEQGRTHQLVGLDNRISSSFLPRLLPRRTVIKLVSSILKRKSAR